MALAAGLTDLDVLVLQIAHLTDAGGAVGTDDAHLAGGHTDLGVGALLGHQLGVGAGGANQLGALAGVQLHIVDHGTHGDVGDGQAVAGLDVGSGAGEHLIAGSQADGRDDVALLAVLVLHQRDVGAAVGIVLQTQDGGFHIHLVALEVDDAVLALLAAAAMADGDAAVAVATSVLLQHLGQAGLGLGVLIDAVEAGDSHVPAGRGGRLKSFDRHSLHSLLLHHTLEELDGLGIFSQLDVSLFPALALAGTARAHALGLAIVVDGIDLGDLHAEDLLHGVLDLDLTGGGRHLEHVLLVGSSGHGTLGNDGTDDDVVYVSHYANTSSITVRASLSSTRYLALRMS